MGIILVETKETRGDGFGFLFKISTTGHILDYEGLMLDDEKLKEYLKENPFPIDKHYSEEDFITDLDAEGSISVFVEKRETAEYLCELFYELV